VSKTWISWAPLLFIFYQNVHSNKPHISHIGTAFIMKWVKMSVTFITWLLHWKNCTSPVLYGCSFNNFDAVLIVSFDTAILHSRDLWGLQCECSSQTLVLCNFSHVKTDHLHCCYPSINMPVILTLVTSVVTVSVGNSNPGKYSSGISLVCVTDLSLQKLFIYRYTCTCIYSAILSVASTQQPLVRNLSSSPIHFMEDFLTWLGQYNLYHYMHGYIVPEWGIYDKVHGRKYFKNI